jgi:hypothetical protein
MKLPFARLVVRLVLCLALAGCLAAIVPAQGPITTPNGAKSDATMMKLRQIDMLVQLLPLAIRKDQYAPLLAAIEKARANERAIRISEDAELAKLDTEVTDAVNDGITKGAYPPKDLQMRAAKLLQVMSIRRHVAFGEMMEGLTGTIDAVFDDGQKTVMEKSLDPYAMDPSIKKDSLDRKGKIRFFIQQVFLDPLTYDLLIKLETGSK